MPITLVEVLSDKAQSDGRRFVTYRYTWLEGLVRVIESRLIASGVVAFVDAQTFVPILEAEAKRDEFRLALELFYAGRNMATEIAAGRFKFLTSDEVHRKCLRNAHNQMEDPATANWPGLAKASPWVQTLSNANIRTWMQYTGGPSWTIQEAGNWKGNLASIQIAVEQSKTGKGYLEEEAA